MIGEWLWEVFKSMKGMMRRMKEMSNDVFKLLVSLIFEMIVKVRKFSDIIWMLLDGMKFRVEVMGKMIFG